MTPKRYRIERERGQAIRTEVIYVSVGVWGLHGLVTFYVLLVIELSSRRVYFAGATPSPNTVAGGAGGGKRPPMTEDTVYPTRVGADLLHAEGITGAGVTVAVLDTGWDNFGATSYDTNWQWRVLSSHDAIQDVMVPLPTRGPIYYPNGYGENDENGHATHVTSIILSQGNTNPDSPELGLYNGIAPDANLVVVKAFGGQGEGSYADVIRGLDWVVANKDVYGIRVLNCSFSATPRSH